MNYRLPHGTEIATKVLGQFSSRSTVLLEHTASLCLCRLPFLTLCHCSLLAHTPGPIKTSAFNEQYLQYQCRLWGLNDRKFDRLRLSLYRGWSPYKVLNKSSTIRTAHSAQHEQWRQLLYWHVSRTHTAVTGNNLYDWVWLTSGGAKQPALRRIYNVVMGFISCHTLRFIIQGYIYIYNQNQKLFPHFRQKGRTTTSEKLYDTGSPTVGRAPHGGVFLVFWGGASFLYERRIYFE